MAAAPALWRTYGQVFASRRIAAMLLLGFSSGLPLALTAGALQAWLTVEGISIRTIGYFALVGLPYTFKFVWAPLLDRFEPRWLGRRRAWILAFQLLLAGACFAMARLDPAVSVPWIATMAVGISFLSASQDIVFDAYRADLLDPEERGAGAAVSVLGYRLAMLVSGGAALIIADKADVHRSRVQNPDQTKFDIHDRVNYATTRSFVRVDAKQRMIALELEIDTQFAQVIEYFEIFLSRMTMVRQAVDFLGCEFRLVINQTYFS